MENQQILKKNTLEYMIKFQSICRKWLTNKKDNKKNIYLLIQKFKTLNQKFYEVLNGYHMINKQPIKESVWEQINCDIVRDSFNINHQANGSHSSGKDNSFDNIHFSNKTTKIDGNNTNISSYRLTNVCNDSDYGNYPDIRKEVEKRDNTFDYYSILIRKEKEKEIIEYMWYIIPKDYYIFRIDKLKQKIGKMGKKKNKVVGWETEYCDITFSMSSQLWYKFNITYIEKYKVCSTTIDNSKSKINYSQIFHSFKNTI